MLGRLTLSRSFNLSGTTGVSLILQMLPLVMATITAIGAWIFNDSASNDAAAIV